MFIFIALVTLVTAGSVLPSDLPCWKIKAATKYEETYGPLLGLAEAQAACLLDDDCYYVCCKKNACKTAKGWYSHGSKRWTTYERVIENWSCSQ